MPELEAPPRIDELGDWPAPEAQDAWYGAGDVEALLAETYRSGRMHHGWLFSGPKGIGKATLAFRWARFILANPDRTALDPAVSSLAVGPDARTFRQIAAGAHPNLLVLRRPWDEQAKRYKTELTVGEIRRIQSFFGSTAGEPGWRICIVDTADELNISAANALLKVLEEPPSNGLFLLIANRPGQLLPTIRSRCRRLMLRPLEPDQLSAALSKAYPDSDESILATASSLAEGSLRRAIELVEGDAAETYAAFADLTAKLPEVDYRRAHALADAVSGRGREDAFAHFLGLTEDWLARRVRGVDEPSGSLSPGTLATPLATWPAVWEKVRDTALQAETLNLDRKQVVLQVFMALAAATRM